MSQHISYYKEVKFLARPRTGTHLVGPERIPMWMLGWSRPYGYAERVAMRLAAEGFSLDIPGGKRVIAPAAILEVSYVLPEWTFGDVR